MALAEEADEHGLGIEVIHGDIEKPLDLRGVEIHGQDPVDPGGGEQVGDQLGGDRHPRLVLAILTGVAEKRHDRSDALGAGAARGVNHDQQFHDVVIGRRATRLDNENILTADVFIDFHRGFAVGKSGDLYVGKHGSKVVGNALGKCAVGGSTDDFHEK